MLLGSSDGLSGGLSDDEGHGGFLADGGARCTGYRRDSGDEGIGSDIRILFGYCTILRRRVSIVRRHVSAQGLREMTEKARSL